MRILVSCIADRQTAYASIPALHHKGVPWAQQLDIFDAKIFMGSNLRQGLAKPAVLRQRTAHLFHSWFVCVCHHAVE